ncbi:caspase family protein [Solirubrobacter ginsenosidimutans]|uniref:Caspase family protein n=1 Tax=Solirubrobacter ginsenosidimutans TaxID=490573 RepID=A0A9X3MVR4_9ACTN|nr:caspase family protein [Solirubrobacter ginsenosidimutans]MDA0162228.1 caspase family protein [Solirubrobacter ginsenosidimutans]
MPGVQLPAPALILLGAAEFPNQEDLSNPAFGQAADAIRRLAATTFELPEEWFLDLFDQPLSPSEMAEEIKAFLARVAADGPSAAIVYYIGHGEIASEEYRLALQGTRRDQPVNTMLGAVALAEAMQPARRTVPQIVVVDACLGAGIVDAFKTPRAGKGVAVFAAASRDDYANAPDPDAPTLFTAALTRVLRDGDAAGPEWLSLEDVSDFVQAEWATTADAARPELHDPEQREGEVSKLRIFRNAGRRPPAEPASSPWCIVFSSGEDEEFTTACRDMQTKYFESIQRELGFTFADEPVCLRPKELVASPRNLLDGVRHVCRADVALFDLTEIERDPVAILLLGIRAVIRRGVTVCSSKRVDDRTTALFHLREVRISSHEERPYDALQGPHDTLGRRVRDGLRELRAAPHRYADLPAFDPVRAVPPTSAAARPRTLEDGQVLVLCSFDEEYTRRVGNGLLRALDAAASRDLQRRSLSSSVLQAKVARSLDIDSPRQVSAALYEAIRLTEFCVVDLTEWRPNVLFELGVRLAASPIVPIVILEQGEQGTPERDALVDLFQPIRYETASLRDAVTDMTQRHRELRQLTSEERARAPSLRTHNAIYPEAWRFADAAGEAVAGEVVERLQELAAAMITDKSDGRRPTVYPPDHALAADAESNGVELLVAAWLYLTRRKDIEDKNVLAMAKTVGDELVERLPVGDHLADEIFAKLDELEEAQ